MAGGMEREGKEVFVIVKLLGLPFFKVSSLNLVILSLCNRFHTEIQPAASRIDLAARTCWALLIAQELTYELDVQDEGFVKKNSQWV